MAGALQVACNLKWSETALATRDFLPRGLLEHFGTVWICPREKSIVFVCRRRRLWNGKREDCQFWLGRRWGRMDPARVKHSMVWNFFTPLESDNGDGAGTPPPPPAATGGSAAAASGGRR